MFCYCFASILQVFLSLFPRKTIFLCRPCLFGAVFLPYLAVGFLSRLFLVKRTPWGFGSLCPLPFFLLSPSSPLSRGRPGCSFCRLLVLCRQDLELEAGAALHMPCVSLTLLSLFSLCPGQPPSASASLCLSFFLSFFSCMH